MQDPPDEPSPWGSPGPGPSPGQGRTPNFGSIAEDPSQTPFGYDSNTESSAVSRAGTEDLENDGLSGSETTRVANDDLFPEQVERSAETRDVPHDQTSAPGPPQQPPPETPQKSHEQVRAMEQGQGQGQGQAVPEAQPAKPTAPQPRLQAKITGLERTGKKDPIFRFDVHVGLHPPPIHREPVPDARRQTSPASARHSIATSAASTPSLSS